MTYAARTKYDEAGRARRYRDRSPRRDRQEWALLERLLAALPEPPREALDVPCGTGRIAQRLLERGIPTRAADLSAAMRAETIRRLGGRPGFGGVEALDLERVGSAPIAPADLVVCFRFLHHLPDAEVRGRVLRGLRRLTGRDLFLSFHHPVSLHHLERTVRSRLMGRPSDRYVLWPRRLRAEARAAGLELVALRPLARWRRELWVAWLRPRPPDASA